MYRVMYISSPCRYTKLLLYEVQTPDERGTGGPWFLWGIRAEVPNCCFVFKMPAAPKLHYRNQKIQLNEKITKPKIPSRERPPDLPHPQNHCSFSTTPYGPLKAQHVPTTRNRR